MLECSKMSSKGFTLIEVVLAMGLIGMASVALLSLQSTQLKVGVTEDFKTLCLDLKSSIQSTLANPQSCVATLGGHAVTETLTSGKIIAVFDSSGVATQETLYEIGPTNKIFQGKLFLKDMSFSSTVPASNTGPAFLYLKISSTRGTFGSNDYIRQIPMTVTLDASGKIEKCQALGSGSTTTFTSTSTSTPTASTAVSTSLSCQDPASQCTESRNYCTGVLYVDSASTCLCTGGNTLKDSTGNSCVKKSFNSCPTCPSGQTAVKFNSDYSMATFCERYGISKCHQSIGCRGEIDTYTNTIADTYQSCIDTPSSGSMHLTLKTKNCTTPACHSGQCSIEYTCQ